LNRRASLIWGGESAKGKQWLESRWWWYILGYVWWAGSLWLPRWELNRFDSWFVEATTESDGETNREDWKIWGETCKVQYFWVRNGAAHNEGTKRVWVRRET